MGLRSVWIPFGLCR